MATTPLLAGLVLRPHHTALCVDDFEAARAFFTDLIGMVVEGEMDQRGEAGLGVVVGLPGAVIRWAMLELQGYRVELFKYYNPADGRRAGLRQCDRGLTHIAFQVNDADEAYARLRAAGIETYSAPQDLRGGRSRPFYAVGPEGIAVEFIELRDPPPAP
ncbi:VOC family protein [Pseudorhodoferax sp.]|uniref:VOC family protein n=1 Tax=Pseudorhodoferax sp. TaxID=1993553 RepID=UPI002DD65E4B|nr:VOC family protein [Pseudorhodoferax sp.]